LSIDDFGLATVAQRPDKVEDRHLKVLRRAGQPPADSDSGEL